MKKHYEKGKLRYIKNSCLFICLFFGITQNGVAQEQLVDRIDAIIGNEIILHSDIQNQIQLMVSQGYTDGIDDCTVLDQMLLNKLLVTQANRDSVIVEDEEVEGELDRKINYYVNLVGSVEQFEEYYDKSIREIKDEFRRDIKDQLLAQRMQGQITGEIVITPTEVRQYFNTIPTDSLPYFNTEFEVSQIVIKSRIGEEQKKLAFRKTEGLKKRLDEGESFELLASLYSEDPGSAEEGGALGEVGRGQFVPEFEAAAFALKDGQISDIVESDFGYHIIKLNKRIGEIIDVSHILIIPKATSSDLEKARIRADSVFTMLRKDSLTFFKAVKEYSDDEATRNNGGIVLNPRTGGSVLEADQVEPSLYFVIDTMKKGAIAKPILYQMQDGATAYRIVRLDDKTLPHAANLEEDYDRVAQVALQFKQNNELMKWVKKRARKTYISVKEEYRECKNINAYLN